MKENKFEKYERSREIKVYYFLAKFFFAFTVVVLLLELFGVIDEAGILLGVIGILGTLYFGMTAVTKEGIKGIEKGIGRIEGGMGRIEGGIGRIEGGVKTLGEDHKGIAGVLKDISEILVTKK